MSNRVLLPLSLAAPGREALAAMGREFLAATVREALAGTGCTEPAPRGSYGLSAPLHLDLELAGLHATQSHPPEREATGARTGCGPKRPLGHTY